jgi:hypothetical protein
MTRYLKPRQLVEALRNEGIELALATINTKRNRTPEAIPFKKISGRIYYPWPEAYIALVGEPPKGEAA